MEAELPALLTQTLSPDRDQRRGAEDKLSKLETQPGFSLALLRLVQQHSAPTAGPESRPLRSSASIYFKNLVRRSWDSEDEGKENRWPPALGRGLRWKFNAPYVRTRRLRVTVERFFTWLLLSPPAHTSAHQRERDSPGNGTVFL